MATNEQLKDACQSINTKLISDVNPDSILDVLFEKRVISTSDNFDLLDIKAPREKARKMLAKLHESHHPEAFVHLYCALEKETAYEHLIEEIKKLVEYKKERPASDGDSSPRVESRKLDGMYCPNCNEMFAESKCFTNRRPVICCRGGHTVCEDCYYQNKSRSSCPSSKCSEEILSPFMINQQVLKLINSYTDKEIDREEIDLLPENPNFYGMFTDVYETQWKKMSVTVKAIRPMNGLVTQLQQMKGEINLAIGLLHHNVVTLMGITTLSEFRLGIVMERVDRGSLATCLLSLDVPLAVNIARGIADGLKFLHREKKITHFNIKPQNILLVGPDMTPKISDVVISKVIRSAMQSLVIEAPHYTAPELLVEGQQRTFAVDIYSFSVILFEMFAKQLAGKGLGSTVGQMIANIIEGKRPEIPHNFPDALQSLVTNGWAHNPEDRSSLEEFYKAFDALLQPHKPSTPTPQSCTDSRISMLKQSREVAEVSMPLPVLALKWSAECDESNSDKLRLTMVESLKKSSNMREIINSSVLNVMKMVPRHKFIYDKKTTDRNSLLEASYIYNKPMRATSCSNESAPEIIGSQLSLTEIVQGQSVLLVGIKGGYIQSLVAQMVGINGSVSTVTSNLEAMSTCRDRVNSYCPLSMIMQWIQVENVGDPKCISSEMKKRSLLFHTVIFCGAVSAFPHELIDILRPKENVSIMAPVGPQGSQRFQMYVRSGKGAKLKTITDFGVIFEEVK